MTNDNEKLLQQLKSSFKKNNNFFLIIQPAKNCIRKYDNMAKVVAGQKDDYITGVLLCYLCFKKYYKVMEKDLMKQQKIDADPKGTQ